MDSQPIPERVAAAIESDYVIPAVGRLAAALLRNASADGALPPDTHPARLAEVVSAFLLETTSDLHLRLIHHPDGAPDLDGAAYDDHWSRQAQTSAGGVRRVERIAGNVALVELGPVIGHPTHAGEWLAAGMRLCAGARAVVLDLRECVGGTPDGIALICSHLFGSEPVHLLDVEDHRGVRQFWTNPVRRRLGPDCPVAVLTSRRTFSGGEELAFHLQELGRACVFGERTRGGAHPRIGIRVHDELELALPVARPHSPRTGRNWEGDGVRPDVACAADQALARALAWLDEEQVA